MPLSNKDIAEFAFDLQVGLEGADVPEYDAAGDIGKAAVLAVNLRGLGEVDYGTLRLVAARHFHIRSDVLDRVVRSFKRGPVDRTVEPRLVDGRAADHRL